MGIKYFICVAHRDLPNFHWTEWLILWSWNVTLEDACRNTAPWMATLYLWLFHHISPLWIQNLNLNESVFLSNAPSTLLIILWNASLGPSWKQSIAPTWAHPTATIHLTNYYIILYLICTSVFKIMQLHKAQKTPAHLFSSHYSARS